MRWTAVVVPMAALAVVGGSAGVGVRLSGPPTVPAQYRQAVAAAAASCPELTPELLAAQLEQESGWDPGARSAAGAQGIAQFLPAVWAAYGADGDGDGVRDVWNPTDAILAAGRFDCRLLREVAGVPGDRVRNMLAAYNAGAERVRRYRGVPPYPQTRAYVATILDRARVLTLGPAT